MNVSQKRTAGFLCRFMVIYTISMLGAQVYGQAVLFDFENRDATKQWSNADEMALSDRYATSGQKSVVLRTPEWKPGMNEWPIWETSDLAITDWSGYDRLVIDFTNPSDTATLIRGRVADDVVARLPSYKWPVWSFTVEPRSHYRAVIPLQTFIDDATFIHEKITVDRRKISRFMLYTARATANYNLHVDNIVLLRADEPLPSLPAGYVRQVAEVRLGQFAFPNAQAAFEEARNQLGKIQQPNISEWGAAILQRLQDEAAQARAAAEAPDVHVEQIGDIGQQVDNIAMRAARLATLLAARSAFAAIDGDAEHVVAWATSMDKVLPRDMPLGMLHVNAVYEMMLARNESESAQLVVIPFEGSLTKVEVEAGALTTAEGVALPAEATDVRVVGYVHTKRPAYDVEYVGWWPDPLLDFLEGVTIEEGDAQAFWLRVRLGKGAAPGVYEAPVRVIADGIVLSELTLRVRVLNFEMPDASPLPIATMEPNDGEYAKYDPEPWETFKFKVADFLADYYIDYDEIYRSGPPDFEILRHLRDQGRLKAYNLATVADKYFRATMSEEEYQAALARLLGEIGQAYEQAKKDDLLEYAYVYGMDEAQTETYPMLKRVTDDVKARFPDLPIMTTAMDYSYGKVSGAESVDVWIPLIHEYKPELAKEARQRGKKVWWYTCQTPAHPYPNIFIEYPAIETRLLMGAITAKYQPDGFLYYCTFRDLTYDEPARKAVDSGPFTDWNPRAFVEPFNGEGYLFYPGPKGRPLASIRLENFRDGLEDYAYWQELNRLVDAAGPGTDADWLKQARKALRVPPEVVKSAHEFTTDSATLYRYRTSLAELIEAAGK